MSFSKSQRFGDKTSSSQSSGSGGAPKQDMSRHSSLSRKGSRPCSKDSARSKSCNRDEASPFKERGHSSERKPISIDEMPVGKMMGNMEEPQRDDNEVFLETSTSEQMQQDNRDIQGNNADADDELTANVDVKQSSSFTSKKGPSSIPVRTSSAPPKPPVKQTSPRFPRCASQSKPRSIPSPEPANRTDLNSSNKQSPTKRSLEIQFFNKKKKLDELRKQLVEKQKPVVEVYQSLVQLKKKLEESGKNVTLEPVKFMLSDGDAKTTLQPAVSRPQVKGEEKGDVPQADISKLPPNFSVDTMKDSLKAIPRGIVDICKNLHEKRMEIIEMVETSSDPVLSNKVAEFKAECRVFEDELGKIISNQEKQITCFINKWIVYVEKGLPEALLENDNLRKKLEEQERTILEMHKQQTTTADLQQKVKDLEVALQTERAQVIESKEKSATTDQKTRAMKMKMRDVENKTKDYESKISDLHNHLQQAQSNLRMKERQWEKEKQDILKLRKQDQQVIEKMTKDKAATESRLKAVSDLLNEKEAENQAIIRSHKQEVENYTKKWVDEKVLRDEMEAKYHCMQQELTKMEATNQEAVDVVKNRRDMDNDGKEEPSMREKELYTELKATQVALKDAQEQLEILSVEKLRFIDSIDKLNEYTEEGKKNLAKSIFKKDEEITNLNNMLKEKNDVIDRMSIETKNMQAKVEFMQAKVGALQMTQDMDVSTAELKETINEGKLKLEYALKKSLDNEQKVIKYENELDKQQKTINEMENLLKVRDGLIGMIKMKKDELVAENDSLSKYAHEMRQLLLEAKEELRLKVQLISELTTSIANYQKQNLKLEKKVSDLEGVLTNTNEKRYKLQDAIGSMEKELQTTKAHVTQLTDMQTRYDDPGMQQYDVRKCNSMPQRITPVTVYRRFRNMYDKNQRKRVLALKRPLNSTILIPKYTRKTAESYTRYYHNEPPDYTDYAEPFFEQKEETDETIEHFENEKCRQTNIKICNVYSAPTKVEFTQEPIRAPRTSHVLRDKEFLRNMRKLSKYDKNNERTKVLGNPQDNSPFLYDYSKLSEKGNVLVCKPASFVKLSHAMMQHHSILETSCDKLRKSIDDSLHLIEARFLKAKTTFGPVINFSDHGDGPIRILISFT